MNGQPLISVCIPCYNGERFVASTIESILNQSFTNYELLIVDDASTDGTFSILESFKDPRIRLSRNKQNLGMGRNWNKAVSSSVGKYVKLLCGDDLLDPRCLEQQVAALESPSNRNAVLAVCNREVINSRGKVVLRRRLPFGSGLCSGQNLIGKCIRGGTNLIGEPAVGLFRRAVLNNVSYSPSNPYLIDLAFWADVLRHGDAFIDQAFLAAFRISSGAVSTRVGWNQARAFRKFVKQLQTNGIYRVTDFDLILGYCLSFQWCILRNLFRKLNCDTESHATC